MPKLIQVVQDFIAECWHSNTNRMFISDFLSKNCLHQKTIGKCIGKKSFLSDCNDWASAFPDYTTQVSHIQKFRNLVICDVIRTGTHLNRYQSTNVNQKTILGQSDFLCRICNMKPTGVRYQLPAQLIFGFEGNQISQILIEEDPFALSEQLGLLKNGKNFIVNKIPSSLDDRSLLMDALNQALGISLSMREMECLAIGFCGFSAKHIAEILHISHRTVESFFHHAYQKLGCYGKQETLELMYKNQLLTLWLDLEKLLLI